MANMNSSRNFPIILILLLIIFCFMLSLRSSNGTKIHGDRVRAVSLGGWLVAEGWVTPSLLDGIPNKDLLDGTGIQVKSVKTGKYLSAEDGGGKWIVANNPTAPNWGTFILWRINETMFNFRVYNKQFLGLDGTKLVAVAKVPNTSEAFEIVRASHDKYRIRIKASNDFYLQVRTEKSVAADGRRGNGWRDDDPSVFEMVIVLAKTKTAHTMNCEFQITNGYGPDKAPHVMREHWRTFVTKKDFKFLSENGLNAVRIPVGWWIASDPSPPWPYVGGSLNALDNAFSWAEEYNIKIILDLHAAPGSQNGFCHGSSRDGLDQEWGQTDQSIDQTIAVIEFLTSRYANKTSLYAIELLNEPLAPIATLEIVTKYYKAGYEAVRKYSSTAYVLFSARLIPSRDYDIDRGELFPLASRLPGSVIDIHLYNLFNDYFKNLTVQQNLDYILINTSALLNNFTTFSGVNGPPVFVGEWVDEWETMNATEADYKKYAQVQKEVYDKATFGWCYWTLKHAINHWSFEWMVRNGYLKLT